MCSAEKEIASLKLQISTLQERFRQVVALALARTCAFAPSALSEKAFELLALCSGRHGSRASICPRLARYSRCSLFATTLHA
jgi:hypothetical protein